MQSNQSNQPNQSTQANPAHQANSSKHKRQAKELPAYIDRTKTSYERSYEQFYPKEDIETTDMFAPFFQRKRTWLVMFGILFLLLAIFFMPVNVRENVDNQLDPMKIRIGLGIFFCIAFLWLTEAMPLAATALLVPVLAVITGVFSVDKALSSFANPLIYVFFGGFALASAMAYQGVDRFIANRLVMLGRGNILLVSAFLFVGTAFLSMWMSNTATTAMMIPLVLGILAQIQGNHSETEQDKRTGIFLLLGVAYSASIGGLGTVIGSPPNGIAAQAMGINFQQWMKFGVPAVILLLPLMFLVLFIVTRPNSGQKIEINREPFVFNWHRIATLCIFAFVALCWIFSGKIKAAMHIKGSMDALIAIIAVLLLLYFRVVRWRDIDRGTDWGVLMLFGGGLSLSAVLKETGTSLFLARMFSEAVHNLPLIWIVAALVTFVIFLTELSSNTATAALFVPIFMAVAKELNADPAQLVIPLALAASCAFMLPVATPPNAIVFATGKIPQKSMMRIGFVLNVTFIIALTILADFVF